MEHKHHAAISLALLLSIIILISCTYLSVNDSPHNINEQNHRSTTHQRQLTIVDPKTVHLRSSSPLTTLVKSDAEDLQSRHQCPLRELPDISSWQAPEEFNKRPSPRTMYHSEWDNNCLKFECDRDIDRCDTMEQTNYEGPTKPCCVHILRDMAKAFDDVMCELGLEYYASYGMLLGLIRADKLIPWTADNDYIVTKQTISALLALSEEEKQVFTKHGISFFYDNNL